MKSVIIPLFAFTFGLHLFAAPTANEDYVDRQDAQTYTNAVTDANAHADAAAGAALSAANAHADAEIIAATGAIRKVDGAAKLLPRYLWALDFEDAYTNDAAWYYARENYQGGGHCSARRTGNLVERNFDWKFDRMAEVIVRMVAGPGRFASVGVANVGTNLTEDAITSGVHSRYFKCLPGHTVDGVNENGVVIEVNVTGGTWPRTSGAVHGLGAVRWALDHATNAQHAAEYLAANVYLPDGFGVNFHYLIADAEKTYIVENGEAIPMTGSPVVMTNFNLGEDGEGLERYRSLTNGASMVSQWWTAAYNRNTRPIRYSDLGTNYESIWDRWDQGTKESHRGEVVGGQTWWQTVHTSVYDMESRTLRICVQETEDWYVFGLPGSAKDETDPKFAAWLATNPLAGFATSANTYTKGEVDTLVEGATPSDYNTVKANASAGSTHAVRTDNPHGVTAAQVGAFPAASGTTLQQAVQVISVYLNAEDARDIVTNYNSAVNMPSRRLEYKEPDGPNAGQWRVVWDELTRWNWLTGEYLPANFYTKAEVDARTDHIQWGLFDSQTGNFSPEKTVQISSDRVILCKGASYQRTATASGTYFVWTSNEPYSITGVESNGYFRIEDAEGNVTFEIVKGDKVTAAATAGGVSTEQVMGITHLHIRYPIEADTHPTLEICNNLTTHDWKPETDPGCLANVTWSGVSGNYTAEVWGKAAEDALFVKATYERGSDQYVRYAQAIALQTVKIGNTIYYVGTATISGHTVLTLSLTPQ